MPSLHVALRQVSKRAMTLDDVALIGRVIPPLRYMNDLQLLIAALAVSHLYLYQ